MNVEEGERSVEYDLKERVEGDKNGAIYSRGGGGGEQVKTSSRRSSRLTIEISVGNISPYENHCDTPSDTDEDETLTKVLCETKRVSERFQSKVVTRLTLVRQESPCERKHEERKDDPVGDEGEEDVFP